jgi:hypothetical protein
MKYRSLWLIASVMLALVSSACSDRQPVATPGSAGGSGNAVVEPVTDPWIGQWNGPEGTFLKIVGGQGKYEITIQNLDGPRKFQGNASGKQIQFERDGLKESIRATSGAETGMKWLGSKSNCLTVRTGEGYCKN